jgi:hypothetical protein
MALSRDAEASLPPTEVEGFHKNGYTFPEIALRKN